MGALARLIADPEVRARFNAASPAEVDAAIATLPADEQPAARAFEAAAVRMPPEPAAPARRIVHMQERRCDVSPTSEHAWQWCEGDLVCAHCGGQRERVSDPWGQR